MPIDEPAVLELLDLFRTMYSYGDVLARHFVGQSHRWSRVDLRRAPLPARLSWFLRCLVEDEALPELLLAEVDDVPAAESWEGFRSYPFEGVIIEKLLTGGVYQPAPVDPERARVLARAFVDAVVPDRQHAEFLRLATAWTPWFTDIMDDTIVITAWGTDDWWLIATNDTD